MSGWVAGAIVVGSIISSDAASSAAETQAGAAREAGTTSLEGLQLQIAADAANVNLQIAAQKDALTQTLAAQKTATDAGNAAAQNMLNQQLAAQKEALDNSRTLGTRSSLANRCKGADCLHYLRHLYLVSGMD